jgi:hypothetical protein
MPNWKTEALKRISELVDDGKQPEDAVLEILPEYEAEMRWEAEMTLLRKFKQQQKDLWAEPRDDMDQLRFNLEGFEFAIADAPVRYVDEDGDERFKPARFSTGSERLDSTAHRIQHHLSWVRRSEAEHSRETEQNAKLIELGIDPDRPWDKLRHTNTVCWRCGKGWRAGDPFELGHCDKPQSQGGRQVAWEHRSCNRSAQDNPVAELPDEDEAE